LRKKQLMRRAFRNFPWDKRSRSARRGTARVGRRAPPPRVTRQVLSVVLDNPQLTEAGKWLKSPWSRDRPSPLGVIQGPHRAASQVVTHLQCAPFAPRPPSQFPPSSTILGLPPRAYPSPILRRIRPPPASLLRKSAQVFARPKSNSAFRKSENIRANHGTAPAIPIRPKGRIESPCFILALPAPLTVLRRYFVGRFGRYRTRSRVGVRDAKPVPSYSGSMGSGRETAPGGRGLGSSTGGWFRSMTSGEQYRRGRLERRWAPR